MFPKTIKIGRMQYTVEENPPDWLSRSVYGEAVPHPPTLRIVVDDNPCPGETLFHEIWHGLENVTGIEAFANNDDIHTVFIFMLYTVLVENGFITEKMTCADKVQ